MQIGSSIFTRRRSGGKVILFQCNHQIPFFWLMLLDKDDIELFRSKIAQQSNVDAPIETTNMALDKIKAISLAAGRRDYVKKHVITCLRLFDDWLYYLQVSDFSDMTIYVDLYHVSLNYSDLNHFCDSMLRAVVCFDNDVEAWNEATIAATCGYENRINLQKPFGDMSKAYCELNQKNIYGHFDNKLYLKKKMSFTKKRWIVALVLIIATLVFGLIYFL